LESLEKVHAEFYVANVQCTVVKLKDVCIMTIGQNNASWFYERKFRITGSVCYILYTYYFNKNPDWVKKIKSIKNSTFQGNDATKHGNDSEPLAIAAYEKTFNCTVILLGLVTSVSAPWLAYSADGIVLIDGCYVLIEVKCPVVGQLVGIDEAVEQCSYLVKDNQEISLRKKHRYYGQIQLGLLLLRLELCHFIVFCSYDASFICIPIVKDNKFLEELVPVLGNIYFNHMLPELCA
jgi:hypothetical protein